MHGPVTEQMSSLVTAQLLYLESEDPQKPINMYINRSVNVRPRHNSSGGNTEIRNGALLFQTITCGGIALDVVAKFDLRCIGELCTGLAVCARCLDCIQYQS